MQNPLCTASLQKQTECLPAFSKLSHSLAETAGTAQQTQAPGSFLAVQVHLNDIDWASQKQSNCPLHLGPSISYRKLVHCCGGSDIRTVGIGMSKIDITWGLPNLKLAMWLQSRWAKWLA